MGNCVSEQYEPVIEPTRELVLLDMKLDDCKSLSDLLLILLMLIKLTKILTKCI
jgi:hypothetical protein